jgi:uncharacterized protein (TIGR00725 family)
MNGPIVGVFGTWRASPSSTIYHAAMDIGRVAARHNFTVLTGGYSGIMEAAVRGAREDGGRTVGYSWGKLDNELAPNDFLDQIVAFTSAEQRMARLVGDSDICVFFPGRTGTVAELALATELRAKGEKPTPLVLVGDFWGSFFSWLENSNSALGYPPDPAIPVLHTTVSGAGEFERYLEAHEHHWNK